MALREFLRFSKLTSILKKNPKVQPHPDFKNKNNYGDSRLYVAFDINSGVFVIPINYKQKEKLVPMIVGYSVKEDYHFVIHAFSKVFENESNQKKLEDYFSKNGTTQGAIQNFLKYILNNNIKKLGGYQKIINANFNAELSSKKNGNKEIVDGYVLKINETFFNDKSVLTRTLYDDLEGLSLLCVEVNGFIDKMQIKQNSNQNIEVGYN